MKNTTRIFFGIIALAALIGLGMASCGNNTTSGAADEPLVYSDTVDGKVVKITISRTDPSRVVLTPRAGDFYVIEVNGVVVSRGTVSSVASGGRVTFTPAADSPGPATEFTGTYATGSLSLPRIPTDGGDLTGVNATPGGGSTPPGGGGAGTPTPLPPSGGGGGGGITYPTEPTAPTMPTEPPSPGFYEPDGVNLEYSDMEEVTVSRGADTYTTTHYLLTDTFAAAEAKLIAAPKYDVSDNPDDVTDLYTGTSLSNAADFVILEVSDFGATWGTEYRLVEDSGGLLNDGAMWRSDEMMAAFNGPTPSTEPASGTVVLKPSDASLAYLTYNKTTYPFGLISGYLILADYDTAYTALFEEFGNPERSQDYTGDPPPTTRIELQTADYTDGDPTFPYNNGINMYVIRERGINADSSEFLMRQAEWYPPLQ